MHIDEMSIAIKIVFFLFGAAATALLTAFRNRVRKLGYKVSFDKIGSTLDDTVFGKVKITWNDKDLSNIYICTVSLKNKLSFDLEKLVVKIYTGNETKLLSQYIQIVGTTSVPKFTSEFANLLFVEEGKYPSPNQFEIYNHNREFLIPVLNRNKIFEARILVTTQNITGSPSVWMESSHKGLELYYSPDQNEFFGVPTKITVPLGLLISALTLLFCLYFYTDAWVVALICMAVGLFAQILAAVAYRVVVPVYKVIGQ